MAPCDGQRGGEKKPSSSRFPSAFPFVFSFLFPFRVPFRLSLPLSLSPFPSALPFGSHDPALAQVAARVVAVGRVWLRRAKSKEVRERIRVDSKKDLALKREFFFLLSLNRRRGIRVRNELVCGCKTAQHQDLERRRRRGAAARTVR